MTKPRLTYFDAPVSRGEECRLAFHVANVEFEDVRLKRPDWLAMKPSAPFGTVPFLEVEGKPVIGQSNAILVFVGRQHDLHPQDPFEAARHESILQYVEDMRATVGPTMRLTDEAEKKKAREHLATTYLPQWGATIEKHIGDGPFLSGSKISVADIKLYMGVQWFRLGVLDHIPTNVFDASPKLMRLHDAVAEHPRVKDWRARF